ncbi:MAG: tetratricopeptide repeat protein [Verrucomicrobiae bacterium]|nr:tetratricopeptide repeat protein [Verrucomicrobiae bacterium]
MSPLRLRLGFPPREGRAAFGVFLLALGVRLWALGALADSPFFEPISGGNDRALYDGFAQHVARGARFPAGVFEFMPLYPWVLGTLYALVGPNLYAAGFFGAGLDALTAALIAGFARRLGARRGVATLLGALYALYPTAIAYAIVTMPNTLNAFLLLVFAGAAWCLGEAGAVKKRSPDRDEAAPRRGGGWAWFGLGWLGGVAALGYAGMLLVAGVVAAWLAAREVRCAGARRAALRAGFFALGFALPLAPVTLHNWHAEGRFVLVTAHGGFNFFMGNHAGATGYPVRIGDFRGEAGSLLADARAEAERTEGRALAAAEVSAFWSARARAWWREHPADALRLLGVKAVKLFHCAEYDDLRLLPMLRLGGTAFASPLWPSFAWLAWLGLAGLLAARAPASLRLSALAASAGIVLFFITSRYRLTLAPLLAVLGALALSQLADAWVVGARRRVAALAAAFFAAVVPVAWPLHGTDFRALDRYNAAAFLLQKGQLAEAERLALEGLAIAPGHADLHFALGNALFAQGRATEARAAFENAVKLDPQRASAHYNLAVVCRALGDRVSALREAAEARRLDPLHPRVGEVLRELARPDASPVRKGNDSR